MKDIMDFFKEFTPVQGDGYVDITLPIVMHVAFDSLKLRIIPGEKSYMVCCVEDYFTETNDIQKRYFDIFMKWDKNYHYNMQIKDGYIIYKEYENNHTLIYAIDEFVRFFVLFDEFINNNYVVGQEEKFD